MYVGNLSFDSTEGDVRALFEEFGNVASVNLISDRETGRPRGFGFVEMNDDSEANAAMTKLNGAEFQGRNLNINEARAREDRGGGGGGFGGGRGGGGGGRGGFGGGGGNRGGW
ncbi:MAG: RNA-binding protein [Planctomycetota bacterium]